MSGRRHRSNCELVAQGIANIAAVIFGGMPVTGTIARTATNVRSGAKGPVSGMLHAIYVLLFMLVAAPACRRISRLRRSGPCWRSSRGTWPRRTSSWHCCAVAGRRAGAAGTFLLVIFEDLTMGISPVVSLGRFLFLHRMAQSVEIETGLPMTEEDRAALSMTTAASPMMSRWRVTLTWWCTVFPGSSSSERRLASR